MATTISMTAASGSGTLVQDIVEDAYELSGIIGDGDTPTAAQLAVGLSRYNSMMQSIGVASNRTWLRKTVSVAMANATLSYNISAAPVSTSRPIRIIGAYIRSGTTDTPLYRISKQEYFEITNKATSGVPTMYWYDADAPTGALYVYPVPATASLPLTVYLDIVHQYEDAQLSDTFDAPAVWKEAAVYQLTIRLCARYGRDVDPDLTAAAKLALAIAQGQDYMENLPMTEPATRGM